MALQRVSKQVFASGDPQPVPEEAQERRFVVVEPSPTKPKASAETVATRTGMVVTLERRPTVDRAWVVWVASDETMIDLRVVEESEDRRAVLAEMVKKHGGAK